MQGEYDIGPEMAPGLLTFFAKHRINSKLRALWVGVVLVAILNFVLVARENVSNSLLHVSSRTNDGSIHEDFHGNVQKRLPRSIEREPTQDARLSDSFSSEDKYANDHEVEDTDYRLTANESIISISPRESVTGNTTSKASGKVVTAYRAEGKRFIKGAWSCDGCFKTQFMFSSGEHICRSIRDGSPEPVDILILITTAYTHMRERATLRKTWLTRTKQNTAKVRYAFILGWSANSQLRKYVARESEIYRDIVIADFMDSYSNLTYKTIAAFSWARQWCGHTKFVMKTDDDMYVNIENLIALTVRFRGLLQTRIMGSCKNQSPVRISTSQYYISEEQYPYSDYPTVCSGTGYVTSIRVIERITNVSPNVPYFPLEDVYVAFCLNKLGLGTRRYQGFLSTVPRSAPLCIFKRKIVITGHIRNWRTTEEIWNLDCSSKRMDKFEI